MIRANVSRHVKHLRVGFNLCGLDTWPVHVYSSYDIGLPDNCQSVSDG